MPKYLVQFDGSNFYNKVKKILPKTHLTNYDYFGLANFITNSNQRDVIYYVGAIRKVQNNKKSNRLYSNQQILFTKLRNQKVDLKLGYLLLSNGVYHEKGVDVQIAVDIVKGAIKRQYKEIFIISSDTDLLPAIKTAQEEGIKIVYVGFENFVSKALRANCDSYVVLKKSQIERFADSKD